MSSLDIVDFSNNYFSATMHNTTAKNNCFDYVFIGLGASNCLILLSIIKNNIMVDKKIAIIDSNNKKDNDKTYCFWIDNGADMHQDLKHLISYTYEFAKIDNGIAQNISTQPYYCIKSIDLYNAVLQQIAQNNIPFIISTVDQIEEIAPHYKLITNTDTFFANQIFDSRPPSLNLTKKSDIFLHQSFYGLHIKLINNKLPVDVFNMMNFDVEQNEYTQFVYTLPYAENEALVEFTRFGVDKMDINYGKKILHQYIQQNYGNYEVIAEEIGCIPMTTIHTEKSPFKGIIHTGARANLIKPSTGYGFKNMYNFAERITHSLKKNPTNTLHQLHLNSKFRFKLYDHLLLIILFKWPYWGKTIFQSLFKNQSVKTVFLFLDEKTNLLDEIKIFAKLPILPFIKALVIYMSQFISKNQLITVLLCSFYLMLQSFIPQFATLFGNSTMIIGMLLIGLPHGAVDHLLMKNPSFKLIDFLIKYVLIMCVYFVLWQILPGLSLFIFIIYAAFHFGESELEEMNTVIAPYIHLIASFLIGIAILLFIIFTHLNESIGVITNINGLYFVKNYTLFLNAYQLPIIIVAASIYLLLFVYLKKINSFLLIILLIGIKMPLLFSFGAYFIGQHSAVAWKHISSKLNIQHWALFKKAMPFTIGAVLVFMFIVYSANYLQPAPLEQFYPHFFIFLACISLPHIILMHSFYKKYHYN